MNFTELKKRCSLVNYAGRYAGVSLEKRGGEHWGRCPFHGENTASFAIKTKNGEEVFYCQGCGKGGDIIKFVQFQDHCSAQAAGEKLTALYCAGDAPPTVPPSTEPDWPERTAKVTQTFRPMDEEKPKKTLPISRWAEFEDALQQNAEALSWLSIMRGITAETARDLHLGYSRSCKGRLKPEEEVHRDNGWILFPRIVGDKVVAVKMRSVLMKAFSQWPGMDPKALFNVETINSLGPVFVTEGELDTAALEQAGFCAVSMPNASTKLTPDSKNRLKQASGIFLAGDNDGGAGNAAMKQLALELRPGTYTLLWPGAKDANEFFLGKVSGGDVDKFRAEVTRLMDVAMATPVEGFTSLDQQLEDGRELQGLRQDVGRLHFPLKSVDDMHYTPNGKVVIIFSTYTGTGKTVFVTQLMIHEAMRGETVVVYSPEITRDDYLALVIAQVLGKTRPEGFDRTGPITREDRQAAKDLLITYAEQARRGASIPDFFHHRPAEDRLSYFVGYDLPVSGVDAILDFIEDTVRVIRPTRFVIDTLHRICQAGSGENQTQVEARVIKRLEDIADNYGCLFVLIGQSNKEAEGIKEQRRDEYGKLRGSRELEDVPYTIYLIHRKRRDRNAPGNDLLENKTEFICLKQRMKGPGKQTEVLTYIMRWSRFELPASESNVIPPIFSEEE